MNRATAWTCLATATAVAIALRLPGLLTRSMWFDEAVVWEQVTNFSWPEMVRRIGLAVHPPGFFASLRVWTLVGGTSLVSLRLFSIAWGAFGVVATYLFCRDAFAERSANPTDELTRSRGIGVTAGAFLALGSYHIVWTQQARMYGMGATLAVFSSWLLVRALRADASRCWWFGYTLSAAAAMYTHNFLLFTVFAQGCIALAILAARSRREGHLLLSKRALMTLCAVYGSAAIAYLPWVPTLLAQSARVNVNYWIPPFSLERLLNVWYELFVPETRRFATWGPVIVAGVTLTAVAACAARRQPGNWITAAMAVIPILCAVVISLVSSPIIVSRYFLYSQVFVFVALAEVLWRTSRPIHVVLIVTALCDLALIHTKHWSRLDIGGRPGMAAAMRHVLEHRAPDEPVLAIHPSIFHAVEYYVRPEVVPKLYLEIPMAEIPHFKGGPLLVQEDVVYRDDINAMTTDSVWVVSTTGFPIGFEHVKLGSPWEYAPDSGRVYREVFDFQGEIIVARYVRRNDDAEGVASHVSP